MATDETKSEEFRINGKVSRTMPVRGYFWLVTEDGDSYFAHVTQLEGGLTIQDLRIDDPCSFIPGTGYNKDGSVKGPIAKNIQLLVD